MLPAGPFAHRVALPRAPFQCALTVTGRRVTGRPDRQAVGWRLVCSACGPVTSCRGGSTIPIKPGCAAALRPGPRSRNLPKVVVSLRYALPLCASTEPQVAPRSWPAGRVARLLQSGSLHPGCGSRGVEAVGGAARVRPTTSLVGPCSPGVECEGSPPRIFVSWCLAPSRAVASCPSLVGRPQTNSPAACGVSAHRSGSADKRRATWPVHRRNNHCLAHYTVGVEPWQALR